MRMWKKWERAARSGEELKLDTAALKQMLGRSPSTLALYSLRGLFHSLLTESTYNLLRILCKAKIDDAAAAPEDRLPAQFNFLNIVEQGMEVEFIHAAELDSIALFFMMSVFMAVRRREWRVAQMAWTGRSPIFISALLGTATNLKLPL